jgi:hypothetical protein
MSTRLTKRALDEAEEAKAAKEEKLKRLLEQAELLREDAREIMAAAERVSERQTEYAGKIMLLDGGTLTLTFTAIGAIEAKLTPGHHLTGLHHLFLAWSLLISSMIWCIASQKLLLASAGGVTMANHVKMILTRLGRVAREVKELGLEGSQIDPQLEKVTKSDRKHVLWERFAHIFLFLAETSIIVAFILLFFFLRANVSTNF